MGLLQEVKLKATGSYHYVVRYFMQHKRLGVFFATILGCTLLWQILLYAVFLRQYVDQLDASRHIVYERLPVVKLPAMPQINFHNVLNINVGLPTCMDSFLWVKGPVPLDLEVKPVRDIVKDHETFVANGGHIQPSMCTAKQTTVIVLPVRDREENLQIFLHHIFPILRAQMIDARILVMQQSYTSAFNKGILFNAAFKIIRQNYPRVTCVIYHDVDTYPTRDDVMYRCSSVPLQLAPQAFADEDQLAQKRTGSVLAMTVDQISSVNGYSNMFFGMQGVEKDMRERILIHQFNVSRVSRNATDFQTHKLVEGTVSNETLRLRSTLVKSSLSRLHTDGLVNVDKLYNVSNITTEPLFERVDIDVFPQARKMLYNHFQVAITTPTKSPANDPVKQVGEYLYNMKNGVVDSFNKLQQYNMNAGTVNNTQPDTGKVPSGNVKSEDKEKPKVVNSAKQKVSVNKQQKSYGKPKKKNDTPNNKPQSAKQQVKQQVTEVAKSPESKVKPNRVDKKPEERKKGNSRFQLKEAKDTKSVVNQQGKPPQQKHPEVKLDSSLQGKTTQVKSAKGNKPKV